MFRLNNIYFIINTVDAVLRNLPRILWILLYFFFCGLCVVLLNSGVGNFLKCFYMPERAFISLYRYATWIRSNANTVSIKHVLILLFSMVMPYIMINFIRYRLSAVIQNAIGNLLKKILRLFGFGYLIGIFSANKRKQSDKNRKHSSGSRGGGNNRSSGRRVVTRKRIIRKRTVKNDGKGDDYSSIESAPVYKETIEYKGGENGEKIVTIERYGNDQDTK